MTGLSTRRRGDLARLRGDETRQVSGLPASGTSKRRTGGHGSTNPLEQPHQDPLRSLTSTERRIVSRLASGAVTKKIASEECVSIATVRSRIASAKRKTGARTLPQLVAMASHDDDVPNSIRFHDPFLGGRSLRRRSSSDGRLHYIRDRYDLANFLAYSPRRSTYLRRAANAVDELTALHGRPPNDALVARQVAVGLESSSDFCAHIRKQDAGVSLSPSLLAELGRAFAATIVAAHHAGWSDASAIQERRISDLLTTRQLQVVRLLATGLRYGEIAKLLSLSERQVRRHVDHAVDRLAVSNTNELVALASSDPIVTPGFV